VGEGIRTPGLRCHRATL